jgi:hypothetical protein
LVAHVPLLDEKVIKHMVVKKNKHDDLINNYMGEDIMEEQGKAKEMLNI